LLRRPPLSALFPYTTLFRSALFAWLISDSWAVAIVMAVAMIGNMLIGTTCGVFIPLVRDRIGKDPAMGSSVLLTFVTDSLGFFLDRKSTRLNSSHVKISYAV